MLCEQAKESVDDALSELSCSHVRRLVLRPSSDRGHLPSNARGWSQQVRSVAVPRLCEARRRLLGSSLTGHQSFWLLDLK